MSHFSAFAFKSALPLADWATSDPTHEFRYTL
jgi:hypothetical protein